MTPDFEGRIPLRVIAAGLLFWAMVIAAAVALVCMVLFWAQPASAAVLPCNTWEAVKQRFASKFHEVPIGGGLINATTILRVLASPDGETWTAVIVDRNGTACIIAAGTGWETVPLPIKGEGNL